MAVKNTLTAERILAEGPYAVSVKVKGANIQGNIRSSYVLDILMVSGPRLCGAAGYIF